MSTSLDRLVAVVWSCFPFAGADIKALRSEYYSVIQNL